MVSAGVVLEVDVLHSERVGHREDGELGEGFVFGGGEFLEEEVEDHCAGLFVGVERGLDVDFGGGFRRREGVVLELGVLPWRVGGDLDAMEFEVIHSGIMAYFGGDVGDILVMRTAVIAPIFLLFPGFNQKTNEAPPLALVGALIRRQTKCGIWH